MGMSREASQARVTWVLAQLEANPNPVLTELSRESAKEFTPPITCATIAKVIKRSKRGHQRTFNGEKRAERMEWLKNYILKNPDAAALDIRETAKKELGTGFGSRMVSEVRAQVLKEVKANKRASSKPKAPMGLRELTVRLANSKLKNSLKNGTGVMAHGCPKPLAKLLREAKAMLPQYGYVEVTLAHGRATQLKREPIVEELDN